MIVTPISALPSALATSSPAKPPPTTTMRGIRLRLWLLSMASVMLETSAVPLRHSKPGRNALLLAGAAAGCGSIRPGEASGNDWRIADEQGAAGVQAHQPAPCDAVDRQDGAAGVDPFQPGVCSPDGPHHRSEERRVG